MPPSRQSSTSPRPIARRWSCGARHDTGEAEVAAVRLSSPEQGAFTLSRTLVADTITKGVSMFARDASVDARFASGQSVIGQGIRSVMCVPLRTTDEILGALYVDSQSGPGRFSEEDLELLAAIGNHTGVALHRVRLLGEIERLLLDTVRAIAATIDAKDGYTHRHSERVAALASRIAAETRPRRRSAGAGGTLGAAARRRQDCRAGLDPQQARPPDGRGVRRDAEASGPRRARSSRTSRARSWRPCCRASSITTRSGMAPGIPKGLSGSRIPLLGRLLGVADFLDALTSARAYHEPKPLGDVVQLIAEGAGVQFDPDIAEAVVRLHARGALNVDDETGAGS